VEDRTRATGRKAPAEVGANRGAGQGRQAGDQEDDGGGAQEVSAARAGKAAAPALTAKLDYVEFPADDPERALRFWRGVLDVELEPRVEGEGSGWQSRSASAPIGVHPRGPGPGDSFSLPYFEVADLPKALEHVKALG